MRAGKHKEGSDRRRSAESSSKGTLRTSGEWKSWLERIQNFACSNTARLNVPDRRPHILTTIGEQSFLSLIDTGAVVTLVGSRVANHLRTLGIKPQSSSTIVSLANGSYAKSNELFEFDGVIDGRLIEINAIYLASLTSDMVLGIDTIERLKLVTFNLNVDTLEEPEDKVATVNAVANLTETEKLRLEKFLGQELPLFDKVRGRTNVITHEIRLKKGTTPIKQRYYPRNPKMQGVINEEVEKMLRDEVIEPSLSGWSSPVVLIKKPSGSYRFCIDFRKLNECTEKDAYPLPRINAIVSKLRKARYITTLDLANGYWQVPLTPESRALTAFTVPGLGLFQFTVMPFGLHSAGATFQRLLDKVIGPQLEPNAFAYLDDLVVISETFTEHLKLLGIVLERLRSAGLKLNIEKCYFCKTELKYLGHVINAEGVSTDPDKVRAIREFPRPTNVKGIRSFLGLASWYRGFVDRFARVTAPLTALLKKKRKWQWSEEQEKAFVELKQRLTTTPILACPDYKETFVLQVDASAEGLGASLTQTREGKEVVIGYASRLLSETERKFTVTEKECLALVWAVKKFRPYIEGYHFVAVTDHIALKWLLKLKEPTGRLARWVLELQQHDFEVRYRKGTSNKVADALSRNPVGEAEQTSVETAACPLQIQDEGAANDRNNEPEQVKEGHREDKWYERLWAKVNKNPLMFRNYVIKEQKLYRATKSKGSETATSGPTWKLCVPRSQRREVLRETHDLMTAGHFGYKKTARRLNENYFWPAWRREVKKYVKECPVCQRYKVEQVKPAGKMHFRPPQGPWHTVSADLMGPLPRSKKGNKFIVAFQDQYSKWIEMAPLKSAVAAQVARKFKELVLLRHGGPDELITDNGTQFSAKIFRDMAKDWDIRLRYTAPYSPQSNPIERRNRVLKTLIALSIRGTHQTWDDNLNEIAYAVNTACHDSTQHTPAMLCYGRELKVPGAIRGSLFDVKENTTSSSPVKQVHTERMERFRLLYEKTQKNLRAAFDRQAKVYNLRRREVEYVEGQEVLKRTHVLSSAAEAISGKLSPKFEGPFSVVRKRGYNVYELMDQQTKRKMIAHVKDLKPYFIREN